MTDKDYLKQAIELAARSSEPVGWGAVLVASGEIVAEAYNSQRADEQAVNHAEIKALVMANHKTGQRKLTDATIYCSCEPCAMCLAALSYANVQAVIFHKKLKDIFPDDKQAVFDSVKFVEALNFVPRLQQLLL